MVRALREAGVDVPEPKGAFYVFADFSPFGEKLAERGIHSSVAMCDRLLEDTGVAMLPGSAFGRPAEELTARIAYVDFDGGGALAAIREYPAGREPGDNFLDMYCGKLLRGIERLCTWLTEK